MLIDAIRLKGFLSHYGRRDAHGNIEPIEVDFRDAVLWLVHGSTGSGKSALFDAVGLALYGEHRGGQNLADHLIHHHVDEALIEVDLTLQEGQYRVQCTLRRKSRKKSGVVYRLVDGHWQRENGTENSVEKWAAQHLRMTWKTFQSTVLLRQGEADVFLKAKPAERRTRLMELIDLTFYQKLGRAADRHLQDWRKARNDWQDLIDQIAGVSDEELVAHEQYVETARLAKEVARTLHERKQAEFAAACRAQQLQDDIGREQQRKEQFDVLLAQAEHIEQNLERFNSLNTAIPWLENVYKERARLAAARQEAQEYREVLATLAEELRALQEHLEQTKCEYDIALEEETVVNNRLKEAEAYQHTLQKQSAQLQQIKGLEERIQSTTRQLESYRPLLQAAANIVEEHGRQEALAQAIPLLKSLDAASKALTQCQTQLAKAEKNQVEAELALQQMKVSVEHTQAAVDEASAQQDALQQKAVAYQGQRRSLQEKLEYRQALTGEEICPTCGNALDNEEVQTRLASEREKWQTELNHLDQESATLADALRLSQDNFVKAQRTHAKADQEARASEKKLTEARINAEHAAKELERVQQDYALGRKAAGAWAEELGHLDTLEAELEHLKKSSRWDALQQAQEVEKRVEIVVTECRHSLKALPQWTGEEREQLRTNLTQVDAMVRECTERAEAAKTCRAQIGAAYQNVQTQHAETSAEKRHAENNLQASSQRVKIAEEEVTRLIENLPELWRSHHARQDENEFQRLKTEWESLAEAPEHAKNLRTAQREAHVVQGIITTVVAQLEQIPQELQRAIVKSCVCRAHAAS